MRFRIRTQPSASLSQAKKLAEQRRWVRSPGFLARQNLSSCLAAPSPSRRGISSALLVPLRRRFVLRRREKAYSSQKVRIATNSNPIPSSQAASGARSDQPCPPAKTTSPGGNGCSQAQFYRANQSQFSNTIAASCFSPFQIALSLHDRLCREHVSKTWLP